MINISKHYKELFKKYGKSVKSVQWSSPETQHIRFKYLLQPIKTNESIVDIGCGFGDLYSYLVKNNFTTKYLGIDFIEEFVQEAKKDFQTQENVLFKQIDVINDKLPEGFDWHVASGLFNNKMKNNKEFLEIIIDKMFNACNKGISFNLLSTYVDYQDESLFYCDPSYIFDFCKKNISKKVTLNHSYQVKTDTIPFEYSIYVCR